MGFTARATVSYGYDLPDGYYAEWMEDVAPDEAATELILNLAPAAQVEVICRPNGGYRLIRYQEAITGNRAIKDIGPLDTEYSDVETLRGAAKLLGLDFDNTDPSWHIYSEFI